MLNDPMEILLLLFLISDTWTSEVFESWDIDAPCQEYVEVNACYNTLNAYVCYSEIS